MTRTIVGVLVVGLASNAIGAEPYRFGPLGTRLLAEDLAAIADASGGQPWAVFGWYSQVLPEVRYVDAFLAPTLVNARLRRGPLIYLQCSPVAHEVLCGSWKAASKGGHYAQVTDDPDGFGTDLTIGSPSERPMRVVGEFTDQELLSLVKYVRSSPRTRLPDGTEGMSISGSDPILEVERQSDISAEVTLSFDGGSGQTATIVRTRTGWHVINVVDWVA
jgi:hypothetical protein